MMYLGQGRDGHCDCRDRRSFDQRSIAAEIYFHFQSVIALPIENRKHCSDD